MPTGHDTKARCATFDTLIPVTFFFLIQSRYFPLWPVSFIRPLHAASVPFPYLSHLAGKSKTPPIVAAGFCFVVEYLVRFALNGLGLSIVNYRNC
ncbi:hypothetical protein V8C43DRAFT_269471 [Trichoderma afarasin]